MSNHSCKAIVVTCIDFRFQEQIDNWIRDHLGTGKHDRVAIAGGVKYLTTILNQIDISQRLHNINKVVLMNHEDCGAYGLTSSASKHTQDLADAKAKILQVYPNLQVETYYLQLS